MNHEIIQSYERRDALPLVRGQVPKADYIDAEFEPIVDERLADVRAELAGMDKPEPVEEDKDKTLGIFGILFGAVLEFLPGLEEYEKSEKQMTALMMKDL